MPSERLERTAAEGAGLTPHSPVAAGSLFGDPARFGILAFLGTVSMLFIGFTSAYILRRASADWQPLAAPSLLWANTLALGASSVSLEIARARLRGADSKGVGGWAFGTGLLGLAFAFGQVLAWRQLAGQGVFLASHPHSSFFYLLTGVHVLHLVGGLAWFSSILATLPSSSPDRLDRSLGLFASYWHFLGGLWLYLLLLLFVF